MPAPKKSLRPKKRPKWMDEKAMLDNEGSTSSPDGIYVTERDEADAVARGNREAKRRAEDTQNFMLGGEVRLGDVRDNGKRGKTY